MTTKNHFIKSMSCAAVLASSFILSEALADVDTSQTSSAVVPMRPVAEESELRPHVGVMMGVANPDGAMSTTPLYGVDIGFQPYVPFSAGLELSRSDVSHGASAERNERTLALAKAAYNFGGTIPIIKDSYVGIGLGASMNVDGTNLISGPLAGFDVKLTNGLLRDEDRVSLGALAKYLVQEGEEPNLLALTGMVKYWF